MSRPTLITVNGTLIKANGTPETGHVSFQSYVSALSSEDDYVVVPSYLRADLDVTGSFSIAIPSTNDPNWNPSGWTWLVTTITSSGRSSFSTVIPYDAVGSEIDFSKLLPAQAGGSQLYAPYNHTHAGGGSGGVTSVFGRGGVVVAQSGDYTKSQVGLGNVDNTSDANKPVSTATSTALAGKESTGVAAGLVSTHNSDTTDVHGIADTSALVTDSDLGSAISAIDFPVDSVAGRTGTVTLTKSDVGLGNVDNTTDLGKPVSTAMTTALNGKANTTHSHSESDITGLVSDLASKVDTADYPGIIVLGPSDPVPGGTASGTVIVRTES